MFLSHSRQSLSKLTASLEAVASLPTTVPLTPFIFETSPPRPSSTSLSPFFRLPREVRDQIYDNIFQAACFECLDGLLSLRMRYRPLSSNGTMSKLPAGLLACKLLLSEALAQFYRKAECWVACYMKGDFKSVPQSPYRFLTLYRVAQLNVPRLNSLVSLVFHPEQGHDVSLTMCDDGGIINDLPRLEMLWLSEHLQKHEHRIKKLKMHASLPDAWRNPVFLSHLDMFGCAPPDLRNTRWSIDLSPLKGLGNRFEVAEIQLNSTWAHSENPKDVANTALVYQRFQRDLEDLAKYFVNVRGGDGKPWSAEDWYDEMGGQWHIEVRRREEGMRGMRNVVADGLRAFEYFHSSKKFVRKENTLEGDVDAITYWCEELKRSVTVWIPSYVRPLLDT